jgi:hypothetical protein
MTDPVRTFAVTSDEALVALILRAQRRLVIVALALAQAVADAVCNRFKDLGNLEVAVVLDSDPEVYRLGFGDEVALRQSALRASITCSIFASNPAFGSG